MYSANSETAKFMGILLSEVNLYLWQYEEFERLVSPDEVPWLTVGMDKAERRVLENSKNIRMFKGKPEFFKSAWHAKWKSTK